MIKDIFGKVALNDGNSMPGYGYGVYKASGSELLEALACAFSCGYRYIDTASFYKNEKEVGEAIKNCGIPRNELFIVSKIWPTQFRDPAKALAESLLNLGLDYLDAYLLHWPGLDADLRIKTFETLLEERQKGKIRIVGVSNFLEQHLVELHDNFKAWPAINQIEVHPLYQQRTLCDFCCQHNIRVVSWSPLGRGGGISIPKVVEIASELGKTPAQVILRWQIQKDLVPIPKSVHAARIRENADVFNFELNQSQMEIMASLELPGKQGRTGKDPLEWPPME